MEKDYYIFTDDSRNLERYIEEKSVQSIVTSPPYYGLRDYKTKKYVWGGTEECEHQWSNKGYFKTYCDLCGAWKGNLGLEPTPELYCQHMVEIFQSVKKVLKDDGVVFLNLGDCYYSGKPAGSSIDAGKKKRNENEWAKLKNADPKNKARRFGVRPIDCPIPGLKKKDLIGIPWRCALALQADGWYLRDVIIWAKAVVDVEGNLDGTTMPGPQKDRCTPSYEYIFQLTKSHKYFFNVNGERTKSDATLRNVWKLYIQKTSPKYKHFAAYPTSLVKRCLRLSTKEKDVVLDPFMGSGTTGIGALELGRKFIGVDLSKDYCKIAKERIEEHLAKQN